MKIIIWTLSIALLVSLLVNFYYWDLTRDTEIKLDLTDNQSKLRVKEADIRTARRDTAIALLQFKMDSTANASIKEQGMLKTEIKGLRRRERLSRQDTITITLTDSVYMADDALILSLTSERNGIKADCKALTDSLLANIGDLKDIRIELDGQVQRRNEALAKEKKKGKWYKRGLIAAGAVIVYLAVKPD